MGSRTSGTVQSKTINKSNPKNDGPLTYISQGFQFEIILHHIATQTSARQGNICNLIDFVYKKRHASFQLLLDFVMHLQQIVCIAKRGVNL